MRSKQHIVATYYSRKEEDFGVVGEHTLEVSTALRWTQLLMQPLIHLLARKDALNVTWSEWQLVVRRAAHCEHYLYSWAPILLQSQVCIPRMLSSASFLFLNSFVVTLSYLFYLRLHWRLLRYLLSPTLPLKSMENFKCVSCEHLSFNFNNWNLWWSSNDSIYLLTSITVSWNLWWTSNDSVLCISCEHLSLL